MLWERTYKIVLAKATMSFFLQNFWGSCLLSSMREHLNQASRNLNSRLLSAIVDSMTGYQAFFSKSIKHGQKDIPSGLSKENLNFYLTPTFLCVLVQANYTQMPTLTTG
mmetsp:Transcript_27288/g.42394  ORF Transcript_27288/g.42394 Transcript_27288/m.42394 type:complete len:109 (-) Transcript_27288:591-917(-)